MFPWNLYFNKTNHPFKIKWDYFMMLAFEKQLDHRLNLPENTKVLIDGYHEYDHADYVRDGAQNLSSEQSKLKENVGAYINDARRSLFQPNMTFEDLMRKNSEFVCCAGMYVYASQESNASKQKLVDRTVDGILMPFIVVHKEVKAKQQLFIYYGPHYR